jgi:hypothetical protein
VFDASVVEITGKLTQAELDEAMRGLRCHLPLASRPSRTNPGSATPSTTTPRHLTPYDLGQLFLRERAIFERRFPRAGRATLYGIDAECFDADTLAQSSCPFGPHRVVARTDQSTGRVTVLDRILDLDMDNIVALIDHELGHVADPTPSRPGAEQRADDLAEQATGHRISYDSDMIETLAPGLYPRPPWLPR